ncbi:hypothetical protein V1524DRAFT_440737 [Lipomyces starkeyi]
MWFVLCLISCSCCILCCCDGHRGLARRIHFLMSDVKQLLGIVRRNFSVLKETTLNHSCCTSHLSHLGTALTMKS